MSSPGLGELILLALLTVLPLVAIAFMVVRLALGRTAMLAASADPRSRLDRRVEGRRTAGQ